MTKFNRRIIVRVWGQTQNEIGSPVAGEVTNWIMWAEVQDRSGSNLSPYAQTLWQYDYKITVRFEKSRPIMSNYTVDYDNKRLKINSVSYDSEGYRNEAVLRCTTIDQNVSGAIPLLMQIGVYNYDGVGNEDEFTAVPGKKVFGAFKDGILFEIIPTDIPAGKQVYRNETTGLMHWGIPFEAGEQSTLQYVL